MTLAQKKALGTIRNTEVVSDSTNVMALESAKKRKALLSINPKDSTFVRICTNHRLIRTKKFPGASMTSHFKIFALTTAGRDLGSFQFETSSLVEHVEIFLHLFKKLRTLGYSINDERILVYGIDSNILTKIINHLKNSFPSLKIEVAGDRGNSYYHPVSYGPMLLTYMVKSCFLPMGDSLIGPRNLFLIRRKDS